MDVQELLHAVEELYFFRRYDEAVEFVALVLQSESRAALDSDSLQLLETYAAKCRAKRDTAALNAPPADM